MQDNMPHKEVLAINNSYECYFSKDKELRSEKVKTKLVYHH